VRLISTSQLAKKMGLSPKNMFAKLQEKSCITREGDQWALTDKGRQIGGEVKTDKRYGTYIVWPEDFFLAVSQPVKQTSLTKVTATNIGEHYGLSARRVNAILSELGWVDKYLKGWKLTELGVRIGGIQNENNRSGVPYITWPASIIENKMLAGNIQELKGEVKDSEGQEVDKGTAELGVLSGFRASVPKQRTTDGHYVRSRAEQLIDNWLYTAEIVHAYERKLPIEEEVYCDFYLPVGKVYIEFWGMESDPRYRERKAQKKEIYEKYGFNLIELNDDDIVNLDDILPRLLLKHGITTY